MGVEVMWLQGFGIYSYSECKGGVTVDLQGDSRDECVGAPPLLCTYG